ncbi:MAG: MogA/MoaB family molybdenum cofactor biosynthesis protein [Candidatus Bathyarchaeia archaeon]
MSETSEAHKGRAPKTLKFAVITCSTSRSRGSGEPDASGEMIVRLMGGRGHELTMRATVPDEESAILEAVLGALRGADVVIITGGTGIGKGDVTIEAVSKLFEKDLPGFGELFRHLSFERIGSPALLTRAAAGVRGESVIFCLPGSPEAVKLAVESLIIPEAAHIVGHLRRG